MIGGRLGLEAGGVLAPLGVPSLLLRLVLDFDLVVVAVVATLPGSLVLPKKELSVDDDLF